MSTNRIHPPYPYHDVVLIAALAENGLIQYCQQCDRYFDVRSGCEEDIRYDERLKHGIADEVLEER